MTISPVYVMNGNMRTEILAVIIQEGTRLCSELFRLRSHRPKQVNDYQPSPSPMKEGEEISEETGESKIEKGTACLPCTNSHLHACVGLLSEAVRMSPKELNTESMERVDKCLGEIAAAERVDLSPEKVGSLPQEERKIADHASREIREIRHGLEGLDTKADLEKLTIRTIKLQKHVGAEWFKTRLAKMPKQEKAKLIEKTIERLEGEV